MAFIARLLLHGLHGLHRCLLLHGLHGFHRCLSSSWPSWRRAKAKDVGCNDGTFTAQLARRFEPRFLLGV